MQIVRLGQGVDSTGRLAPEALERTLGALRGYARIIGELSAEAVRMVATSATRDAANAADFVRGVTSVLGIEPEVLSGDEEAYLPFSGRPPSSVRRLSPLARLPRGGHRRRLHRVRGRRRAGESGPRGRGRSAAVSVDIGCVRMTERHLHADPPRPPEISAATADIDAALDAVAGSVPATAPGRWWAWPAR